MLNRFSRSHKREQTLLRDLKKFADLLERDGQDGYAARIRASRNDLGYSIQEGESRSEKAKVSAQLWQVFSGKDGLRDRYRSNDVKKIGERIYNESYMYQEPKRRPHKRIY